MTKPNCHRSFFSDLKKELMPKENQIQRMGAAGKIRTHFWVGMGIAVLTLVTLWEICDELWKNSRNNTNKK